MKKYNTRRIHLIQKERRLVSAKTIGLISDTHGLLNPRIPELFRGVDHILHAGDIGRISVLDGLKTIAPLTAVAGNVDSLAGLPEEHFVELWGIQIWLRHILGNPHRLASDLRRQLEVLRPEVVVFGHSHQPFLDRIQGILFINPGSAGPRRFDLSQSVGILEINNGETRGRIVNF